MDRYSRNGLTRARVEYAVIDGQVQGTVALPGGRELAFANVAELERCLEFGQTRLVLVGGAHGTSAGDGLATLSPTERAIVKAALTGASNREIANALCYSVKSVEAYLTRVYRRLGIEGRGDLPLVAEAIEDLEPPESEGTLVAGGSAAPAAIASARGTAVVELLLV